jgi:hypothetical protein
VTACLGSTGSIQAEDLSAVPPCPPVRQRARWTARIKIAALDGDRGHPAEPVFRRLGAFARDLRPKNGSRLAFVACTSLGRNPRRSCGDHACADRHSLGRSRLCAHAHRRAVPSLRTELHSNRPNGSGTNKIVGSRSATPCSIKRSKLHVQTRNRYDDFVCGQPRPTRQWMACRKPSAGSSGGNNTMPPFADVSRAMPVIITVTISGERARPTLQNRGRSWSNRILLLRT